MSSGPQRAMRVRKPPQYKNSEEEDMQAQVKNRPAMKRDAKQIPLQPNAMAKLLVKFISQTNQYYKDSQKDTKKQKKDKEKKPALQPPRPQAKALQPADLAKKLIPDGLSCPKKQPYSYHNLPGKLQTKGSMLPEQMQRGMVSQGGINADGMNFINTQGHPHMNRQGASPRQQLYPGINTHRSAHRSEHPMQFGRSPPLNSNHETTGLEQSAPNEIARKENEGVNSQNLNSMRNSPNEVKLFKRSSFHVAIAYHIYFKKLETSAKEAITTIDPTCHAKKLREETTKNREENYDQTSNGEPGIQEKPKQDVVKQSHDND